MNRSRVRRSHRQNEWRQNMREKTACSEELKKRLFYKEQKRLPNEKRRRPGRGEHEHKWHMIKWKARDKWKGRCAVKVTKGLGYSDWWWNRERMKRQNLQRYVFSAHKRENQALASTWKFRQKVMQQAVRWQKWQMERFIANVWRFLDV